MERERKTREKELKGNEREIDRGVKTIFIACASLTNLVRTRTSAALQCGHIPHILHIPHQARP